MTSRSKGRLGEYKAIDLLKSVFPEARRNLDQTYNGGVDLINTDGFSVEVKHGKKYNSAMIRQVLTQLDEEAIDSTINFAIMLPDRESPYVLCPADDFVQLIEIHQKFWQSQNPS